MRGRTIRPRKPKRKKKKVDVTVNINVNDDDEDRPRTKTKVALVIDRSGSMGSCRDAAFSGINEQIETIRRNADKHGKTDVHYIQFDDEIEPLFRCDARNLRKLHYEDYQPRGMTALYDAVWTAINEIDNGKRDKDTAYLVVVISDGLENASRLISGQELARRIRRLEETGQWTFTYMMSNIDLSEFRETMGAHFGNSFQYDSTPTGTQRAYGLMADSTKNYFSMRNANVGVSYCSTAFYSDEDGTANDKISDVTILSSDGTKISTTDQTLTEDE